MSIAVRCTNILRYDPQQGKYVRCHHEFQVQDEQAGESVRCPTCGQSVKVAEARIAVPAVESVSEETSRPATADRRPPFADRRPPTAESQLPAAPDYPEVLEDDEEFQLLAPIELPKRDSTPAATKPPHTPAAPPPPPLTPEAELPADEKAPCPGCGKPLMLRSVICPSCGYHRGLQRRVDAFEESDDENKPTGFERWLRKQLAEGEDPSAIRTVLIIGGLLLMTMGVVLFLMIGHLVWIFVGIAGILAAGSWLGWWKLDPWQWLLFANRTIGWRNPMPPFAHRKVLDLRNMPIGDEELAALKNLAEFDVIDLEGATVTDHGLPSLYDYRNLQFIILRDTQSTEAGAKQLQQALPSAWIWR
jgi:uncharacterized Zn finger protein (UPF0148 family)